VPSTLKKVTDKILMQYKIKRRNVINNSMDNYKPRSNQLSVYELQKEQNEFTMLKKLSSIKKNIGVVPRSVSS